VPRQLAKENRRFVFSGIQEGARSRDYKSPLEWLKDAGLVHPVSVITAPRLPLRAYEDPAIFKLFTVDIGLMGAMAGLEPSVVVEENALFTEFKGSLTEQFVLQEMIAADLDPHYWTNGSSRAEVDFVLQYPSFVAPVEVKAKTNLRSQSLRTYRDKFHPPLSIRMSLAHYELQDGLVNLPLYAASLLPNLTPATKDEARQPRSS
jgi:predicted AAA+ superfamily ATPase